LQLAFFGMPLEKPKMRQTTMKPAALFLILLTLAACDVPLIPLI
jgi:hypothetical protein